MARPASLACVVMSRTPVIFACRAARAALKDMLVPAKEKSSARGVRLWSGFPRRRVRRSANPRSSRLRTVASCTPMRSATVRVGSWSR